ncbi:MAG: SfnB family sulfur acquisition oxidoreductase [Actinobacteria bacterium]|nr:SfnB family sulfur acquisition oxidoreductase [Actinomycetota bacterium]
MSTSTEAADTPAHRIGSDAEAIEIADRLSAAVAAGAIERDRERQVPIAELEELDRSGLLALLIPTEYGGAGGRIETLLEVFRLIAAADPSIAQVPQNHYMFVDAIVRYGTPTQRQLLLSEVVAGGRVGNAISERGGKTALDTKTMLRDDGAEGLRLDGVKFYSTGALTSRRITVLARSEDDSLSFVYVPREIAGLEVDQDWTAFGQRATISGSTRLDDVAVDPEWVIPVAARDGHDVWAALGQILHAAIDVGISRGALDDGVRFLVEKSRPWPEAEVDRPAEEPAVILHFGQLQARVRAVETLLADTGRRLDAAYPSDDAAIVDAARVATAEVKALAADTALATTTAVIDMLGTSATDQKYGLDRHWRNARTHTLHDPTRWKYMHVGNYLLSGKAPDANSFLI